MTNQEIIEMGMQAGIIKPVLLLGNNLKLLTAFAKLIAEKEREECAKICENYEDYAKGDTNYHATLIRTRGDHK